MGFTIYYRSTRIVSPDEAEAIGRSASSANRAYSWLSCEPVDFFDERDSGRLLGGSKPNFLPHPLDAASAAREGLPDGDLRVLVEVLCRLSREHAVDWEFRHDEADWSVGSIRGGVADGELEETIEALSAMGEAMREFEGLEEDGPG